METFEVQNEIFQLFYNDLQMLSLLGIITPYQYEFVTPSQVYEELNFELLNEKIRREELMLSEIKPEVLPFVTFVFIDSLESKNHLVNRGILEVNIFCSVRYEASGIYSRVKTLLKQKFDLQLIHEGQVASGIQGIYCYRTRFRISVNS